jgi:phosphomannomutase
MRIGIDFDRVLFDTDAFKNELNEKFPEFSDTYDKAKKEGFYNFEEHAKLMDVQEEKLLEEMRKCQEYLYEDLEKLEKLREENDLVIVTRGDPVIQKEKLEYSGVLQYVDEYEIVKEGTKDVAEIDVLVDDWKKEIDRIDLPGIIIDRETESIEKIIEKLKTPEFEKVFKRYDIRGRYPEELNEVFAYRLGKSMADFAQENNFEKITVTRDPKESSGSLKSFLIHGIRSLGVDVINAGVGSTDYTAFSTVQEKSIGIQVTSSHMPLNFNGFKLIYPEGNGFMNEDLDRVKQLFRENSFETCEKHGEIVQRDQHGKYLGSAENFFREHLTSADKKIVLENMGGRNSSKVEELLETLGAEVENISRQKPEINPPNPEPENLEHVEEKVKNEEADLGIATDMDADRVSIYFQGRWLSGDEIFAVLIETMKPGKVVASIDSTEIVEKTAEKHGEIEYTRVGDPFVIDRTLELEAELSGEPNGHYCFTNFVPYNSGTLAAAIIAGTNLEEIMESLPEVNVSKKSLEVKDKYKSLEKVKKKVKEQFEVLSEIDGIKFKLDNSRVLIRSSGSSHKLRITAESKNKKESEQALKKSEQLIRNT